MPPVLESWIKIYQEAGFAPAQARLLAELHGQIYALASRVDALAAALGRDNEAL